MVAQFHRMSVDVNRTKGEAFESLEAEPYYDAYHDALEAACNEINKQWGRGILIDIHGQVAERSTIFRGTGNRKTVSKLIERFGEEAFTGPESICGQLEQKGFHVQPPAGTEEGEHPHFSGGYIVQTFGSKEQSTIDAIQLEFGTKLRSDDRVVRSATGLASAIVVFAEKYLPKSKPGSSSLQK